MKEYVGPGLYSVLARLKSARQRARLSQSEAAQRAGIHRPALSLIEKGRQRLTMDTLLALASVYGVRPGDIVEGN